LGQVCIRDAIVRAYSPEVLAQMPGQIALRAAEDVDKTPATATGYAGMVAQMRAALADLREFAAPPAVSPVTVLRQARTGP
jgi:hypothetical protein